MKAVVQVFSLIVPTYAAWALEALSRAQAPTFKFEGADKENLIVAFGTFLDSVIENRKVSDDSIVALRSFVDLAKAQGKVLVIDEANKVLGLGEGQGATSSILSQMVRLTKQSKELDVIMASSEYSYPYLLERGGLNKNDISAILFACEIPPKSIWELVVKKKNGDSDQPVIGISKNLAHLLITCYGGHVLCMSPALPVFDNRARTLYD
jgi:hypothetical protein